LVDSDNKEVVAALREMAAGKIALVEPGGSKERPRAHKSPRKI
jgi:hypothetical protein